ncbi:MAG: tRNA (N(6)-L-threonylcarbamoyladenosine(37)-C(2))-methylthiotransferase MtaB [Clostridium sp.]|nr:tRNA (N(6)-L-threonylcarbamoyladenosine(37)-C(2))-methylthiotransferase MtaB [Clostridium sp.]MCM1548272.1 tRNA (N(6)-L-threonylcarbamoyladenosine(37)-C(2))-methylthiotransferase MtaB [Ruminococcus sp.]
MKAYFESFGCKVNQYETECVKKIFSERGYDISDKAENADVILINSCTVTASGDSKCLYSLRKHRKDNPDAVIVFTGCMPQASPETFYKKVPEADIVTGTKDRNSLPELVTGFLENRQRLVDIAQYGRDDEFEKITCGEFNDKTRAFVKIQDGCNRFCSYCIIPYARGRCRSKPLGDIREEVKALAENGHKEIVLVGINLAFYGKEFGSRLIDAVEECCRITGVERVRLGSLEPEMVSNEDLLRLSKLPQFCPQFHLSLQSGCRRTLGSMHRKYTPEEYLNLVSKIRKVFPDCSITTDIMVGFPQESDEDFEESLAFAEKVGFAKIHVFQYSPRKGTIAAQMPQIPKDIKHERADRMKALGKKMQREYLKRQVGKTVPVLFERESSPDFHQGYAPDYTLIKIPAKKFEKSLRRMIFYVKIKRSDDDCCIGKIIR